MPLVGFRYLSYNSPYIHFPTRVPHCTLKTPTGLGWIMTLQADVNRDQPGKCGLRQLLRDLRVPIRTDIQRSRWKPQS